MTDNMYGMDSEVSDKLEERGIATRHLNQRNSGVSQWRNWRLASP